MQHRGRAAIGAACTTLCVIAIGLGWDGESLFAVLMSCCLLSPALYASGILWTEWAAERKRKQAVGEPTQRQRDDDVAHSAAPQGNTRRDDADRTAEVNPNVAADEALLASLFLDEQHGKSLRAAGHVGQLARVTELELEQAGLPLLQRRALMAALLQGDPTTVNPLLVLARP